MRITIESTDMMTTAEKLGLHGPVRVWRGKTDGGASCLVFVASIGAAEGDDAAQLERELRELSTPEGFVLLASNVPDPVPDPDPNAN
jgi:hypothetical protein